MIYGSQLGGLGHSDLAGLSSPLLETPRSVTAGSIPRGRRNASSALRRARGSVLVRHGVDLARAPCFILETLVFRACLKMLEAGAADIPVRQKTADCPASQRKEAGHPELRRRRERWIGEELPAADSHRATLDRTRRRAGRAAGPPRPARGAG